LSFECTLGSTNALTHEVGFEFAYTLTLWVCIYTNAGTTSCVKAFLEPSVHTMVSR
jgi:hypothetical protein